MTRVPELMTAGLTVAFGHDCVTDPYYPMGSGNMLEVASMGLHVAQMTGVAAMRSCFGAVTVNAARILGLEGYGLEGWLQRRFRHPAGARSGRGDPAGAARLYVVHRGKVIAENPAQTARLHLPGRPGRTNFTD
jgi:cytosine deaminase